MQRSVQAADREVKRQAANGQMSINSPGSQQETHTGKTLRDIGSSKTILGDEREEVQGL